MESKITYQRLVIDVTAQGERVVKEFNTLEGYKYVTGITSQINQMSTDRYLNSKLGIKINRDIVIPNNNAFNQISSGIFASVNNAFYPLMEDGDRSLIEIDYTDGSKSATGIPYQVEVYLKLQNKKIDYNLNNIARKHEIITQTHYFDIATSGQSLTEIFQTLSDFSLVRGIMITPKSFNYINDYSRIEIKINNKKIISENTLIKWLVSNVEYAIDAKCQSRFLNVLEVAKGSSVEIKYTDGKGSFSPYTVAVTLLLIK